MRLHNNSLTFAAIPLSVFIGSALPINPVQAEISLDIGVSSKYLREGVSQTGSSFAYNGGLNWLHSSGLYAGAWASRMRRDADDLKLESDLFLGFYQPLNESVALDTTYTRYQFHGDDDSFYQDYDELGVSLLLKDRIKFGARATNDYLGTNRSWRAFDMSYVLPVKDFNLEFYLANYQWLNKDSAMGADYDNKSHYWHFRIGAERSWNNWDYKLSFERGIVGGRYDGGSQFVFGINRHFQLF